MVTAGGGSASDGGGGGGERGRRSTVGTDGCLGQCSLLAPTRAAGNAICALLFCMAHRRSDP